jgi:hypothetical protein
MKLRNEELFYIHLDISHCKLTDETTTTDTSMNYACKSLIVTCNHLKTISIFLDLFNYRFPYKWNHFLFCSLYRKMKASSKIICHQIARKRILLLGDKSSSILKDKCILVCIYIYIVHNSSILYLSNSSLRKLKVV